MGWLEDFLLRASLAEDGVEIADLILQNMSARSVTPDLRLRTDAWWNRVRTCPVDGDDPQRQLAAAIESYDRYIGDPKPGQNPSAYVRKAADIVRGDAHRFVRNRTEGERRKALVAFLESQRQAGPSLYTDEQSVAETFGAAPGDVERWVEWVHDRGYVQFLAEGAGPGGRRMRISSEGIDWIEQEKGTVSTPPVPLPVNTPTPWTLDVSIVVDAGIRAVLVRNVRELSLAQPGGLHTAAITLAGAIGEGVLYDALVQRKSKAMLSPKAPKAKGVVKDIETEEWNLYSYIEVAQDIGVLEGTTAAMAHAVLRDFRNMIHPKVQVRDRLTPDEAEMKASVAWLEALVRDVRRAPP